MRPSGAKPTSCARKGGSTCARTRGRVGLRDVDDRDPLRLRAESDPEAPVRAAEREVAHALADLGTGDDASLDRVDDDDLTRAGVGDVGVPREALRGRVPRLREAAQHLPHTQTQAVDQADRTGGGVGDERVVLEDRLDAARVLQRRDVPDDPTAGELDGRDPGLEIGRDERERRPSSDARERAGRCGQRGCSDDEPSPIHACSTERRAAEVPTCGRRPRSRARRSRSCRRRPCRGRRRSESSRAPCPARGCGRCRRRRR